MLGPAFSHCLKVCKPTNLFPMLNKQKYYFADVLLPSTSWENTAELEGEFTSFWHWYNFWQQQQRKVQSKAGHILDHHRVLYDFKTRETTVIRTVSTVFFNSIILWSHTLEDLPPPCYKHTVSKIHKWSKVTSVEKQIWRAVNVVSSLSWTPLCV